MEEESASYLLQDVADALLLFEMAWEAGEALLDGGGWRWALPSPQQRNDTCHDTTPRQSGRFPKTREEKGLSVKVYYSYVRGH